MFAKMAALPFTFVVLLFLVEKISGHGMMLEPPNRSSLWRFDPSAPTNEKDNEVWCGGIPVQWLQYDGKCGVCGDPWNDAHPQANENTGTYGQGKVVREYTSGSTIDVTINVTLNHMGYFEFGLCVLEDVNAPETGEDCFQPLSLGDGQDKYEIETTDLQFSWNTQVILPEGLTCDRCVLRWNYVTKNVYGECDVDNPVEGCGVPEMFRSCADVAIL